MTRDGCRCTKEIRGSGNKHMWKKILLLFMMAVLMLATAGSAWAALPAENVTFTCTSVMVGQPITCTATATPTAGEPLTYLWSTDQGTVTAGQGTATAMISSPTIGTASITLKVTATPPITGATQTLGNLMYLLSSAGLSPENTIYAATSVVWNVTYGGYATSFTYTAVNLNKFNILLMGGGGTSRVPIWISPDVTPSQIGINTWTPSAPIALPNEAIYLGAYSRANQEVPLAYCSTVGGLSVSPVTPVIGTGKSYQSRNLVLSLAGYTVPSLPTPIEVTKIASVTVSPAAPTLTLSGPATATVGETKTYAVTHDATDPVTIVWSLNGAAIPGATGTSVDVPFSTLGTQNIGVSVFLTGYPSSTAASTIPVTVAPAAPTLIMSGPATSVEGETKQYSVTHNSTNPVTIEWKLNDVVIAGATCATVEITFATAGSQNIAITVYPTAYPDSKSTSTKAVTVTAYPAPTIKMTGVRTSMIGKTETYSVTHNSSVPVTIEWTLNGEAITGATGATVDISFATEGSYNVGTSVSPTAYPNSKRMETMPVVVLPVKAPLVGVSAIKGGMVGSPITLKATATIQTREFPLVVKWILPDGTSVNALTATYTPKPADVGTATFKFTAHPEGYPDIKKESTLQIPITNYTLPIFTLRNYVKSTGIVPWTVVYAANGDTRSLGTEKLTYTWDMGDGTVMPNKKKAIHTYATPGVYPVTMTIADTRGNSKALTDTVTVQPVAPISVDAITIKGTNKYMRAPMVGILKAQISGGNPMKDRFVTYAWTVNGQPIGRNSNTTTYKFTEPGTHEVGLTVTSKNGLVGTGTATFVINDNIAPECTIEATDKPAYKYTLLISKCTDADGKIRTLSWDLGNGQTSKVRTVRAMYATSGTYTVALTATDDSGGSVTVSKEVAVQR